MVNAQKWLDENYPKEGIYKTKNKLDINFGKDRKEITELDIQEKELEGSLKLEGFNSLRELFCHDNKIASLEIINSPNLEVISCFNNQITELVGLQAFPKIREISCFGNPITNLDLKQNVNLEWLNVESCNFDKQDLSFVDHLVNLRTLGLGNGYPSNIKQGIYNRFYGSLECLKNLTKLEKLDIRNTDIDAGLEYLPESVKVFFCLADKIKNAKCLAIAKLFTDEQGKIETEANGSIVNFSRKILLAKQRLQKEKKAKQRVKSRIEQLLVSNKITLKQLQQQLIDSNHITDPNLSWQNCLENSLNLKEISAWEGHALKAIQTLKNLLSLINETIVELEQDRVANNVSEEDLLQELKELHEAAINLTNWKDYLKVVNTSFELSTRKDSVIEAIQSLKNGFQIRSLLEIEQKMHQQTERKYEHLNKKQKNPLSKEKITTVQIEESQKDPLIQDQKIEEKQIQIKPTLLQLLGKGSYGEVYRGKWKLQDVAIKKLYLSLNDISQKDFKDIQNEINLLKNLRNRYIIQYYDTYSDNQEFLIIMDYAENGTLTKFINSNADKDHDWNLNNNLIKQLALGLAYIHQEGIIHRDLKSMNILLADNYQAKIADFGLSKTKTVSSSQSRNSPVGTVRWMAPEVIKEQNYSEQSDIYSLGMVIWEIATKCTLPFKDVSDDYSVMFKVASKNEKEKIPAETPQNIQNIIKNCWKNIPSERISLENILENLENDNSQIVHSLTLPNLQESKIFSNSDPYKISQSVNFDLSGFSNLNLDSVVASQSQQEQKLQQEIQTKNSKLENLINSAKEKLKSQSKFSSKQKEREKQLNSFFKNFPTNQDEFVKNLESIKENLSKKLTWSEINNLCQTQIELTKLQTELENQQSQQTQIIHNPPKNN